MQTMADQCRTIWKSAFNGTPVTLRFNNKRELERAKFTFYNSIRDRKSSPDEWADWREACEVATNMRALTLTVQLRSNNKFYDNFASELDRALGEVGQAPTAATETPLPGDIEGSLSKLQRGLEEVEDGGQREPTPYYKRED